MDTPLDPKLFKQAQQIWEGLDELASKEDKSEYLAFIDQAKQNVYFSTYNITDDKT